ncbi:hypothetical protein Angca_002345, partial [Angiostrongylus cantonensis]
KLKKRKRWMLHELNANEGSRHFEMSSPFPLRNQNDPFLQYIAMSDENWILCDNQR